MQDLRIEEVQQDELPSFLTYLAEHLSENGKNGIRFQPLTRDQLNLQKGLGKRFQEGMKKEFGEKGWRKLWVAKHESGDYMGHIDIRSRNEPNTQHRVLLGMGVHIKFRQQGIGQTLLEQVIVFCEGHPQIAWLDLEVMTNNTPAVSLYKKLKFKELNTTKDMFRIEGKSYDYSSMTLQVEHKSN